MQQRTSDKLEIMHTLGFAIKYMLNASSAELPCQSINQFAFPVLGTHQGSQQTATGRILRMSSLNDT